MGFTCKRGREHELDRIEPGSANIALNNASGDFWPQNTGGNHYPNCKPLKRIKLEMVYNSNTYPLWEGLIDAWVPSWLSDGGKGPVMNLECTTVDSAFSRVETTSSFASEASGTRVTNILNTIPWGSKTVDAGNTTLQAEPAPTGVETHNIVTLLHEANDAESGFMFIGKDGVFYFRQRDYIFSLASQVTLSDTPSGAQIPYILPEFSFDSQFIYNDVRVDIRNSNLVHEYIDTTSATTYGSRVYEQRNTIYPTTSEVAADLLAIYKAARFANPRMRVKSLKMRTNQKAGVDKILPSAVQYDIPTRVTVNCSQASITEDYYIQGVTYTYVGTGDEAGKFEVEWQLRALDRVLTLNPTHTATAFGTATTYAAVHNASTSAWASTDAAVELGEFAGQFFDGANYDIWRADSDWNFTSIANTNTVTTATLWLYMGNATGSSDSLDLVSGSLLSSPLSSTDWANFYIGQAILGSISNTTVVTNAYNQIPLNTSGIDWLQSVIGLSTARLALMSNRDILNSTGTAASPQFTWSGKGSTTGKYPIFIVKVV